MNKKISTAAGAMMILIIAVLVWVFLMQYQADIQFAQNTSGPKLKTANKNQPTITIIQPAVQPTQNENSAVIPGWQTYNYPKEHLSFQYPGELKVDMTNPNSTAEFLELNANSNNANWPIIEIEYNLNPVPKGTDLKKYCLTFPHDKIGADTTISGLPAVHLADNYSGQAYADDQYFVSYNGVLYKISFIYSHQNLSWNDLDSQFLSSIKFQ